MTYYLFSVYDNVTEQFGAPVLHVNSASAVRWFNSLCEKEKNIKNDLRLFCLGEFDLNSGVITPTSVDLVIDGKEIQLSSEVK